MMNQTQLTCRLDDRRRKLFNNPNWNGMDFLEVAEDQLSLCIHFFGHVPEGVTVDNVRIEGGRRIRGIKVVKVEIDSAHDPELDDCLHITLDKFGDFSTYRLCLIEKVTLVNEFEEATGEVVYRPLPGLDPRYACIDFSFKIDCPSDLDCKNQQECPPEVFPTPEINYLAKDYASFRQLMFDRLAVTMPDWKERHIPDIGVTLVELLAYAGDHLSYYQDAVATEAYLDTARQRISVRRHARLVDYRMHEGNNARAWVSVWTKTNLPPMMPNDFYFITGFAEIKVASGNIVSVLDLQQVPQERYEVFEPLVSEPDKPLTFFAAHSEMHFYTWGDNECCLAKGAIRATLLDDAEIAIDLEGESPPPLLEEGEASMESAAAPQRVLNLQPGDVLIFEEVLGPTTGNAADADPAKRHAVRLTKVTASYDGLLDKKVLEIEWAPEDALPFSLCLSSRLPAPHCNWIYDVSVAHGNVVLVDHGRTVEEPLGPVGTTETVGNCACEGSIIESTTVPERFRPELKYAPLTFGEPLTANSPATKTIGQDARLALPKLRLAEYQVGDAEQASGPDWAAQYDLLASMADERHFVVEMDDDGRGHLRFGDGELGRLPTAGAKFQSIYRTGNGPAGNVGRDTINYLVMRDVTLSTDEVRPRNPLSAQGGRAAEASAEVKLFAPHAVRARRMRAITAEDYAELAQQNDKVQRAACELRWMGSWYEARVAIDPKNSEEADAALLAEIEGYLYKYRRMGHDLAVVPTRYVSLDVALEICVMPSFARGHVKAELLKVFSNRRLIDGRLGFFHPDNLSFGDGIYLSRIVAAAMAVEGVETVKVLKLKRLHEPDSGALESGMLSLGGIEIAQLDNDPNFPENGKFELTMRGGR
jgi:hypothetical protein